MGADLYIQKISDAQQAKAKPIFETAVAIRDYKSTDMFGSIRNKLEVTQHDTAKLIADIRERFTPAEAKPFEKVAAQIAALTEVTAKRKVKDTGFWGIEPKKTPKIDKLTQQMVMLAHDAMYSEQGYFRDSYNGAGLAPKLGFSWWTDVIPMLDVEGNLQGENIDKFLGMVSSAHIPMPTFAELKAANCSVDDGKNSPLAWRKSWERQRNQLVKFLKTAKHMKEPIYCSL